jgi:hypothetical protein
MKKLLLPMAMILLVATGCLLTPAGPNQPPTAYIDSVSPINSTYGETVTFTGHGIDPDGTVGAYSWRSSRDGDLSTAPSFSTSSLSPGTHTIWFKVQDDDGVWSNEVLATVIVVLTEATKPVINSFNASPGSIGPGGSSTLSWDVSGATAVSIDPGVGNVSLNGTRVVFPNATTTYTMTATNAAGKMTATAQVMVSSLPSLALELFPVAADSGHVRQDGYVGPEIRVGATSWSVVIQGFLSFDISMIPKGAVIRSASLDLTAGNVFGSPFTTMGQMYICNNPSYSQLGSNNFVTGPATAVMYSTSQMPASPISSSLMVAAIQDRVDTDGGRFQIRLQFERAPFMQNYGTRWSEQWQINPANYIEFPQAQPKLVIEYDD